MQEQTMKKPTMQKQTMKNKFGAFNIIIAACLWGILGIFVRRINEIGFSTIHIVTMRAIGASLLLFLYMVIFDRDKLKIKLKDIWLFVGTGICSMVFFNFCYFGCMQRMTLAIAAALLYTAPAFVAIFAVIVLKEKITIRHGIAIVIAVLGCAMVSGIFQEGVMIDWIGFMLGIGAGIGYALYSIFGKLAIQRGYSDITITFYTFTIAAVGTCWSLSTVDYAKLSVKPQDSLYIVGLIVCSTILAYIFYTKGLEQVSAGYASILSSLEPVVAALISFAVYKEDMMPDVAIGIVLILGSAVLASIKSQTSDNTLEE